MERFQVHIEGMSLHSYPQFTETTHDIRVTVTPIFIPSESFPHHDNFSWAYHVRMENLSDKQVQLLSRYWKIIDSKGFVKEVRGAGVVGETPHLSPGMIFEYSSGTQLPTPSGLMEGIYYFVTQKGEELEIKIPAFSLDSPQDGPLQVN